VTDHHHPGTELPDAHAIINPKQPGDDYPQKDLAGVGLAFKLAQALDSSLEGSRPVRASDFLDLVALGTVADLAPLVGENRALVRAGIYAMHRPQRQGVLALMGAAGINPTKLKASDIGYGLGPRLNAAGRLDTALSALKLLTTNEIHTAGRLAQELEVQNQERQKITREIQARAEEIALAEDPQALIIFAVHEDFNPGVVGLAASRLAEAFYRPAVVANAGEEFTRASCRSIPEFHITEALDQCADLLEHHGGHAAAAGFTVRNQNLPELERRLRAIAQEQLRDMDLRPSLYADMEISLHELKPEILRSLENMQPTGYGNRQAYFVSRRLRPTRYRTVGRDKSHLKLSVSDHRITYDAIAFRQGYWAENMPDYIDVFYAFEENEYNGRVNLQLNVRDIKPSGEY
jgi:single-stranded-DNA-specific exonuclease